MEICVPGSDGIAIVGMSCRLPGATDPAALWRLLHEGVEAIGEPPSGRLDAGIRGGFITGVDMFDADFFGISPKEAVASDPQQRLALELSWECIEDAGILPDRISHSAVGVFLGVMGGDYAELVAAEREAITHHSLTGVGRAIIANRISHALRLSGPSLTVDTGQSSSLVAVHLACESLLRGESGLALAGGVNLILSSLGGELAAEFGALSPEGRCYAFDARANGHVRGEGGGMVVLKRLADAVTDGDRIYGVIRGSAMNAGSDERGMTVPSHGAQVAVIEAALARAGLDPAAVQYVELHGTGTPVGDPIEAAALGAVYGRRQGAAPPLAVGSIKTNIGHLEGAAGIAGLIKAALCVHRRELVASLNFSAPNPRIPLRELGLRVVCDAEQWPEHDGRIGVGVSSFGMGGANAHLVMQEAPQVESPRSGGGRPVLVEGHERPEPPMGDEPDPPAAKVFALLVSGRGQHALRAQAERLREYLLTGSAPSVVDVAYSLACARTQFETRGAVVGGDRVALLEGLEALSRGEPGTGVLEGSVGAGKTAFMFTGQGAQRAGMGLELHRSFPVFADALDTVCAELDHQLGKPLRELLFAAEGSPEAALLDETEYTQASLFALEVALFRLVETFGVKPDMLIGHSVGEIVAAHVAGVFSLADACSLVLARGRLMGALPAGGAMLAIEATEEEARAGLVDLAGRVSLAAVNGPKAIVVSGEKRAIKRLAREWRERGRRTKRLRVSHAFHSQLMEPMLEAFGEVVGGLRLSTPRIPIVSNVTGGVVGEELCAPDYWVRHVRETVRFAEGIGSLEAAGVRSFLELGPDGALCAAARESLDADARERALLVPALRARYPEAEAFMEFLARAHVVGVQVDWDAFFAGRAARRVDLPSYAFQRKRYWLERHADAGGHAGQAAASADLDVPGRALVGAPPAPASHAEESSGRSEHVGGGSLGRRLTDVPRQEWDGLVLELVRSRLAEVLGHESAAAVDSGRAFKELGLDSLGAEALRSRLMDATGLRLPATLAFDHPSAAAVAGFLCALVDGGGSGVDVLRAAARRGGVGSDEPIAIVGMSCRYPGGVGSPEELWQLVAREGDAIGVLPEDRGWDLERLFDPDPDRPRTSYAREGGFIYDAGDFDAGFFGIGPREAVAMDPQQRLLLEAAWEALEDAGIDPTDLRGSQTGVFAGMSLQDYLALQDAGVEEAEGFRLTGALGSVLSGRVAYTLGFEGPAVSVDTACSSSLVALHLACQAVRNGECSLALAGGVTLMASPAMLIEFSRQRGLSLDGRCRSFAAGGEGVGWSEGAGLVVLERLSDARRQGHRVLAVVRGSAINQDGASNGLTAPNGPSQERVIRRALADADLSPADVDAVEAHGTGTRLGDPIEAQALLATYGRARETGPLWLGSIKSNIGHSQAAAGVAGVIKMVKAFEHGLLPRTLHVDAPTPHVDWSAGEVELLAEAREWGAGERVRRAGVSSFGISGTNAHVILEEPPQVDRALVGRSVAADPPLAESAPGVCDGGVLGAVPSAEAVQAGEAIAAAGAWGGGVVPLVVSGRGEAALRGQAERLRELVLARPEWDASGEGAGLLDVALSLAGRAVLEDRGVVLGDERDGLIEGLGVLAGGGVGEGVVRGVAREGRPVFVFPGQGAQWEGMAIELLDSSPVFRDAVRTCGRALEGLVDWRVEDVLRGVEGAPGLDRVDVVQPVSFAVMVALAELWRSCGVQPAAVVGHSQGEIAAACVAGGLSLEDAARVVVLRSRLLAEVLAGRGGMVSVALDVERVDQRLANWGGRLAVAAVNGPSAVVVSGETRALDEFLEACEKDGVWVRRVAVDYASHSAAVEELRDQLIEALAGIEPVSCGVPFFSTAMGEFFDTGALDGEYWYRSLRERVRFEEAVRALAPDANAFIEVSPHPVLTVAVRETLEDLGVDERIGVLGSLRREEGGLGRFVHSLAEAWVVGAPVDWRGLFAGSGAQRVDLPRYAFQRKRYWLSSGAGVGDVSGAGLGVADHPLLGAEVQVAGGEGWLFTGRLSLDTHPWLADHAVLDTVLLPGTGFLELVLAAGRAAGCEVVEELTLEVPLVLVADGAVQLQVLVGEPDGDGRREITVYSRPQARAEAGDEQEAEAGGWVRHASGTLVETGMLAGGECLPASAEMESVAQAEGPDAERLGSQWPPAGAQELDVELLYESLAETGFGYGPVFQGVQAAWRRDGEIFAEVALGEETATEAARFGVHPALLDAALHAGLPEWGEELQTGGVVLPFALGGVRLYREGASSLRVCLTRGEDGARMTAFDETGERVLSIASLVFRPIEPDRLLGTRRASGGETLHRLEWVELRVPEQGDEAPRGALLGGLEPAGVEGERHEDLGELVRAIEGGKPAPDAIFAAVPTGTGDGNAAQAARAAVGEMLELLQAWLVEAALADSRLVLLSRGAVAVGAGETPDLRWRIGVGPAAQRAVRAPGAHPGR